MAACVTTIVRRPQTATLSKRLVVLLGRLLFVAIFLLSVPGHFSKRAIDNAAAQGVPLASLAVPLSGLMALSGGLSVLTAFRAKLGAWLLVLFLVPATAMMHKFWAVPDPAIAQTQMIMFMKNISMLGAALLLSQLGTRLSSLDTCGERDETRCPGEDPIEMFPGKGDFERWKT